MQGYSKTGTTEEREKQRSINELAADKRLGEARRISNEIPGGQYHLTREIDSYYKTIATVEMGRAVDKAIPKGKDAVKSVLQWGHKTSAKTDAAVGGIPVKTEKEAKQYRKLNERYEKAYNKRHASGDSKEYNKVLNDFEDFDNRQIKRYQKVL